MGGCTMSIPFPDKKYSIIYADPPWEYNKLFKTSNIPLKNRGKFGCIKYDTMSSDEICNLPVGDISEKNSLLFMWATYPCLPDGLKVIEAWGFKFITVGFTWVKKNRSGVGYFSGLGMYTKANAEICIIAKRGKGIPIKDKTVKQIVDSPLTEHSKKPDVVRKRITQLCGDLPRIELFARINAHGWDSWGNDEKLQHKPLEVFT